MWPSKKVMIIVFSVSHLLWVMISLSLSIFGFTLEDFEELTLKQQFCRYVNLFFGYIFRILSEPAFSLLYYLNSATISSFLELAIIIVNSLIWGIAITYIVYFIKGRSERNNI